MTQIAPRSVPRWAWLALSVAVSTFFVVGVVMMIPKGKDGEKAKEAPVEAVQAGEPFRIRIEFQGVGEEVPAQWELVPACWFYNPTFVGPAEEAPLVRYIFEDESEAPVFDEEGVRLPAPNKDVRGLIGPADQAVVVVVTPPGPGGGTEACREYLKQQDY